MLNIKLGGVFVEDQANAHDFYTKNLGLKVKNDIPVGEYRWLSVGTDDNEFELVLEPNVNPAAKTYQKAIYEQGIPATMLFTDDIEKEYHSLIEKGVKFKSEPTVMGNVTIAVFDDTCGNYIQICQEHS
ncbi:VOC family protein [Emcibacteraceae bacterium]|nr:VOC family protein [Emcibacteraceae bacterium]MDC1090258.1 VOC family protein [Emcibacteraceae bacterium]